MEIRYVEWVDSTGGNRWEPLGDVVKERPHQVRTVGFVVAEGDDYVTLAAGHDQQPAYENVDLYLVIPKLAILKSETLRPA